MIVEVSQVSVPLSTLAQPEEAQKCVAKAMGVKPGAIKSCILKRRSVDARKKSQVHWVTSWVVEVSDGCFLRPKPPVQVRPYEPAPSLVVEQVTPSACARLKDKGLSPIVVGAGPAGLFCALYLARAGLAPLVVERGADVDARKGAVEAFNNGGQLNTLTNIQFGEGGAGTFSDGKLNTGTKSPHIRHVLEWFVEAGAPEEILIDAKPHIGTDILATVVKHLREHIIAAGGDVRFFTRLDEIAWKENHVCGAWIVDERTGERALIPTSVLVLACGHSARDTFQMLYDAGVVLERKPFAVGVRIEHPQHFINEVQYGDADGWGVLGAADYKLATHNQDGRGVYTFCMCPGGEVVAAASEESGVCVNGMSNHARDGQNANSALLVEVRPDDLPGTHPLEGVVFQRSLERSAYEKGLAEGGTPYQAPAQRVGDFLAEFGEEELNSSFEEEPMSVHPTYPRGVAWTSLRSCLPPFVINALAEALPQLDKKLHGFASPQAVMTAVEARSSSPVRIVRNRETLQAEQREGLYPCGEGAGYAGGIMSAAVDGLRVAEAIVRQVNNRAVV